MSDTTISIIGKVIAAALFALMLTPLFLAIRLLLKKTGNYVSSNGNANKGANKYFFGFYFNKSDKRVFVPGEFGWGVTLNHGHPYVIAFIVLEIISIIAFICIRYFNAH